MKLGANDFINKPWSNDYLLQSVKTLLQLQENKTENQSRKQLDTRYDFEKIIGQDPRLLDLLETIGRVAKTDASVLITGESGTGQGIGCRSYTPEQFARMQAFCQSKSWRHFHYPF